MPPDGIALAPPIVRVDAVVAGGKLLPVNVTVVPVGASMGLTVIVPLGTVTLTVFVRLPVASVEVSAVNTAALSVTVMYLVPAVTVVGTVTVPTPVPSAPIGKALVPVRVISLPPFVVPMVTVNSAL